MGCTRAAMARSEGSLNKIVLIGRLVRDPEQPRTFASGTSVVDFTIAVDKKLKPKNDGEPTADFFRCKAWGKQGEYVSNYLGKGRLVAVEGRIESRKFVDKDGNNRESWEVSCDSVQGLDRPRDDDGGATRTTTAPQATPAPKEDEYDPFGDE